MVRKILSHGFRLFEKAELGEKQTRVFCSQNILYNIINLIEKNDLKEEEIEMVNKLIQNDIAPYNIMQYPKAEEKEVNLAFSK